jgi:hypothetical protein
MIQSPVGPYGPLKLGVGFNGNREICTVIYLDGYFKPLIRPRMRPPSHVARRGHEHRRALCLSVAAVTDAFGPHRHDDAAERARRVPIEDEVAQRGFKLRREGRELIGPCPVCREGEDRFSVNPKKQVWHCRRCDTGGDVIKLVEMADHLDFRAAVEKLAGNPPVKAPGSQLNGHVNGATRKSKHAGTPIAVEQYDYDDVTGKLHYQVERVEFQLPDGSFVMKDGKRAKTFRQRRPDPNRAGRWINNIQGVERVPYCLPQLVDAVAAGETIFIVEGERKVDMLRAWGLPATCNSAGQRNGATSIRPFLKARMSSLSPTMISKVASISMSSPHR